jgi:hypothetical protein
MASKKYKLLFAALFFLATGAYAQTPTGSGYDVYDSSVISSKRMPQQNEFWNNTYNFPAKPRNMWEVGISAGTFNVIGDVGTRLSPGFAVHVRKAFGYVFSMRLQYLYGIGKGLSWKASENFNKNNAWNAYGSPRRLNTGELENSYGVDGPAAPQQDVVFYNYKTSVNDLSFQGLISRNNIRFHKAKTGFNIYFFGGIGATLYET